MKAFILLRRHQIAVEEDVLDVQMDLQLLCGLHQCPDRFSRAAIADVVGTGSGRRARGCAPPGDDQQALNAEVVGGLHHLRRQLQIAPLLGAVARQRYGQNRTSTLTDGDVDAVSGLADRLKLFVPALAQVLSRS
jgi:hypothetical protein